MAKVAILKLMFWLLLLKAVTAKDFLSFPSPTKLIQLGANRASILKAEIGSGSKDIEKSVETFMKVSSVVTVDDLKSKDAACECADELFDSLLSEGVDSGASLLANTLLVNLGLIKGEDKKFKPPNSITGPLIVLEHVVRQPYFPKLSREILSMFISKSHPVLDKCGQLRHKLLQTLYSF